jgi:hypothetical protein
VLELPRHAGVVDSRGNLARGEWLDRREHPANVAGPTAARSVPKTVPAARHPAADFRLPGSQHAERKCAEMLAAQGPAGAVCAF